MAHIEHKCIIRASLEETFEYVINPANRTRWLDSCLEVKDVSGSPVRVGTTWQEKQKVAGRVIEFTAQVIEFERPYRWAMRMTMLGGNAVFINMFNPEKETTVMTTIMDYNLPGSFFGRLAEKIIFDKIAAKTSRQNAANLKIILESRKAVQIAAR